MRRENWLIYCLLAAVALAFAAWEVLDRRRGRRWPVLLLVLAGTLWLFVGVWLYAMRGVAGVDRSWVPLLAWLVAVPAAVPYVLLRADDEMRNNP
jgi:ABC-type anion transport system duplicated permease subunit